MPTTTLTEFTGSIDTIAERTDDAGTEVNPHWSAEERRMAHKLFTAGIVTSDAWEVSLGSAATMNIEVGSGSAKADLAFVDGQISGQGNYLVRLDEAGKTIALGAASPSDPRIDEVYIVVSDNLYDSSSRSLPRLAVRRGDAAGSPVPPGPDVGWEAYLLIASITVPAAAADIQECTLEDERVLTTLIVNPPIALGGLTDVTITSIAAGEIIKWNGSQWINNTLAEAGIAATAHTHTGSTISALDAGDTTTGQFATARIPSLPASQITSGEFNTARIPDLSAAKITSGQMAASRVPTTNLYANLDSSTLALGSLTKVLYDQSVQLAGTQTITGLKHFNLGISLPGSGTVDMFWPGVRRINDSSWGGLRLEGDNNYRLYFHTSTKYVKANIEPIPIERSIEAIARFGPSIYMSNGKMNIGFIAENVQRAEPLTAPAPRRTSRGPDEVPTYSEDGILAHLVNAVDHILKEMATN